MLAVLSVVPARRARVGGQRAAPPPPEVWVDNWFSYAACGETGKVGVSHTFDTPREARQAALSLCHERGGVRCETIAVNKNSCFSIVDAIGDDPDFLMAGSIARGLPWNWLKIWAWAHACVATLERSAGLVIRCVTSASVCFELFPGSCS